MTIRAQQFLQFCNADGPRSMGWMGNGHDEIGLTGDHLDLNASSTQQQQRPPPQIMMMGVPPLCNQNQQQQLRRVLPPMPFYPANLDCSQSLLTSMQAEKYDRDIDQILRQQSDKMRLALQQQSKQQLALLTKIVNANASAIVKRKEEETLKAKKRSAELEGCLLRMEAEIQAWQRIAKEHESVALDLSDRLEQVQQSNYYNNVTNPRMAGAEQDDGAEASSSCSSFPAMAMPVAGGEAGEEEAWGRRCKWCGHGDSCMLFLPCRHLCCCRTCAELLYTCPICTAPKQASVEVLMV